MNAPLKKCMRCWKIVADPCAPRGDPDAVNAPSRSGCESMRSLALDSSGLPIRIAQGRVRPVRQVIPEEEMRTMHAWFLDEIRASQDRISRLVRDGTDARPGLRSIK